ncbi:C4-dicarboxylate ABC transporter substrate-binding protein [Rodentibacter caecimuris]|uniref:C4-dicarboxylate ABC transporter substrate-binding protein n=1 Tax=Rodentibacter caecimuris TaxID=1796644 RepID=A0AAJ3K5U3_9PAST|nr:TAXI family TRAP transporter solute-binding subunit [Rodentibacter heylii]AOF53118.1 TRAP transporter solute receptor, TAXI family precursor [Pasteurellaceae bacterium NI1060]MCQ9123857.1 TAXI family TRAP transporter solute-binding subunit [Rodentibacter heylii]OOF72761.1 C4-dicarboxylate ABC transporter substrate-binding protein [Rodentibacter heylii]OOF73054.1 C4-dicarboxylate ABC transporter substrate-binding protein [Rodentibacter heylii]OOF74007.1 C4-dicarboxylate ABC transporter subst
MKKYSTLSLAAVLTMGAFSAQAAEKFVTIGTGGQTGVYYVVGQSICQLVNRDTAKTQIKCNAPSTGASVANLNAIAANQMEMGIAQSDWQYHAYNGTSSFAGKKNDKLRAVFSIHPEPFTLMARDDSGIQQFNDLKGKRVNVGDPGSGTRATMNVILAAKGWTDKEFKVASELKPAEMASVMCDNNLDAITYNVGHPNGALKEAAASCNAHLVPITGTEIDKLVADNPYYAKATIPGGLYKGTDNPVDTFGVYATLVTSSDVDADSVYAIVKAVFDNFDRFKRLHPAFAHLKQEDMIKNALSAPLHEGAIRYYKEKGWLK